MIKLTPLLLAIFLLLMPFISSELTAGTITTFAGNGQQGYYGDNGLATSAVLSGLSGIASDQSGNIYLTDSVNHRVRMINNGGAITTIAGTIIGFSGDVWYATQAKLYSPTGMAVDSSGNIYIADSGNYRIRRIEKSTGIITTFAGSGQFGDSGDNGPASSASLTLPTDLAFDVSGNLYISDSSAQKIRKIDTNGIITTFAGLGSYAPCKDASFNCGDGGQATLAKLYNPRGIASDSSGNIYIGDSGNQRIRKVDKNGIITTIAGNPEYDAVYNQWKGGFSGDSGPAKSAKLWFPTGIAVDTSDNIYFSDSANNRIRKLTPNADKTIYTISTIAGTGASGFFGDGGPATSAQLYNPQSVMIGYSGNLYITDSANNRVRQITLPQIRPPTPIPTPTPAKTPTLSPTPTPTATPSPGIQCNELSDCTAWEPSVCPQNQIQTRTCNNKDICSYPTTKSCIYTGTSPTPQPNQCTPYTLDRTSSSISSENMYVGNTYTAYCDYGTASLDCINIDGPLGCIKTGFNGTKAVFSCKADELVTNIDIACKLTERTNSNCCLSLPRKIATLTVNPIPLLQSNLTLSTTLSDDNKTSTLSANYTYNSILIFNATCIASYSDQPLQQHKMEYSSGSYKHSRTFKSKPTGNATASCLHSNYTQQSATISFDTGKQEPINPTSQISVTLQPHTSVQTTKTITFSCSATGLDIRELSLYTNTSGIWKKEETKQVAQSQTSYNFILSNIGSGQYKWNCEARTGSTSALASDPQFVMVKIPDATPTPGLSCNEAIDCTDWPRPNDCPPNQTETRTCKNKDDCDYTTKRSCLYAGIVSPTPTPKPSPTPEPKKKDEFFNTTTIIIIAVVIIAVILILIILKRRGSEPEEEFYDEGEGGYQEGRQGGEQGGDRAYQDEGESNQSESGQGDNQEEGSGDEEK